LAMTVIVNAIDTAHVDTGVFRRFDCLGVLCQVHALGGFLIDDRADEDAFVLRIAHAQLRDRLDHLLAEFRVDRGVHENALHADAALAGLVVRAEHHALDDFVERIGERLVDEIPAEFDEPAFRYSFDVVNMREINAFALPGGPMFLNRGMIEAASTEASFWDSGVVRNSLSLIRTWRGSTIPLLPRSSRAGIPNPESRVPNPELQGVR